MERDKILEKAVENTFRFCSTCYKYIQKDEPHIMAYKKGCCVYYCQEHVHDAEHFLKWYGEFVSFK